MKQFDFNKILYSNDFTEDDRKNVLTVVDAIASGASSRAFADMAEAWWELDEGFEDDAEYEKLKEQERTPDIDTNMPEEWKDIKNVYDDLVDAISQLMNPK